MKSIENKIKLISTISRKEYNISRLEEVSEMGEPLEVYLPDLESAKIRSGKFIWERFADFLPFPIKEDLSLGEGNTPLLKADLNLKQHTGLNDLYIKNETLNPTGSFKDRGSLLVTGMCREMKEKTTATISTGNMGGSISAYGNRAGIKVIVFVPENTPLEKIKLMAMHGPYIIKVKAPDYSLMKKKILSMAGELGLRIVSGNGPIRTEGYKLTAFELFEQLKRDVPDYIAVPTSACGHIRGIFKGYRELLKAGLINRLPKMIVVQAENNSPIVSAIKRGKDKIIPFNNIHTVAHAITSGEPFGGNEIINKANRYGWLAEDVSEAEILDAQQMLSKAGFFVEPASATILFAVKKLRDSGRIGKDAKVILILTGSEAKDFNNFKISENRIRKCRLENVEYEIFDILKKGSH